MTATQITPSGPPVAYKPFANDRFSGHYVHQEFVRYVVRVPAPAPPELRVAVKFGQEDNGVWAHIEELDVSAEGADAGDAFRNVVSAARDWLAYIAEEAPELSDELAPQKRYLPLLEAPVFSWFRAFEFADK